MSLNFSLNSFEERRGEPPRPADGVPARGEDREGKVRRHDGRQGCYHVGGYDLQGVGGQGAELLREAEKTESAALMMLGKALDKL